MAGRKAGQCPCWYWFSDYKQKRDSWVFATEQSAITYKNQKWWRYAKYPRMDDFLDTIPYEKKERERDLWILHRDYYRDWILKKGTVKYDT